MLDKSTGGCLCGASRFAFEGAPRFAIQCYCRDCQHVSGGGHLPQLAVATDAFSSSGPIKTYSQISDAGNTLYFSFCETCGSPLTKATSKMPEMTFVYPGAMDAPPDVSFENHVFEDRKQPWDNG